jgi:hypothetical protein
MPQLRCLRRPHAADAATALLTVATPLPRCLRCSSDAATALPMLPPRCRHRCRAAATPTALPQPLRPPCRPAACRRRRLQRCHCAADAALVLLTPPSYCAPLPLCCRAASATLPTLPLRFQRRRHAAAAVAVLPPLPTLCHRRHCRPVTLLPRCLPPLSCRCKHHRHCCAAAATLALPTPPQRCPPLPRRCRAASAALLTLPPRCCR